MPVYITDPAASPVLGIMGEELRPLTPDADSLAVQVFDTTAPDEAPGEAGPPPHRHPWDEVYVVLRGVLGVFDGCEWRPAAAGRAREFFEHSAAELTVPPDLTAALTLAARHDVEAMPRAS